jgi:acyl carrier protein
MTVKEQIYEIIARRMKRDLSELRGDMNLKKDLGADSIDTVEIVFEIEELYGVDVPDDLAETINTIDDAVAVINNSVDGVT